MSHSSTMPWLTDSQLYLHSQGDVVHVWKCKKLSSVLMPMKPNDFDDLGKVTNHLDLVLHFIKWDETKYKTMVRYISERRFLVNCEGLVIIEIYQFGEDGNIDLNVDPIYIRLLDVIQLDTYIDGFAEQSVPFRTLQYLELDPAMSGNKVPQEENSSSPTEVMAKLQEELKEEKSVQTALERDVIMLTAELADLMKNEKINCDDIEEANKKLTADLALQTKKVVVLESKNKTLESNVTKTTSDLAALTNKVADLECKIMTLEGNAKMMTADLAVQTGKVVGLESTNKIQEDNILNMTASLAMQMNKVTELELKIKTTLEGNAKVMNADLTTERNKVIDLVSKNRTLEGNITKATNDLKDSQQELERLVKNAYKEVWMNDESPQSYWVGFEGLPKLTWVNNVNVLGTQGTFMTDCKSTNVKARYSYKLTINSVKHETFKAVIMEDLVPNKQKASFVAVQWWSFVYQGNSYAVSYC